MKTKQWCAIQEKLHGLNNSRYILFQCEMYFLTITHIFHLEITLSEQNFFRGL